MEKCCFFLLLLLLPISSRFLLMAAIPSDAWEGTSSATSNPLSSLNRYLSFDVPTIVPELFCGIVRLLARHINKSKFVVLMAVDPG